MRRLALLTCIFWISLSAGFARASIVTNDDMGLDVDRIELPLDTQDARILLAAARNVPEVRLAMDDFRKRGYVAHPEFDVAAAIKPGESAACFLIFEKPGYVPDPNCVASPVIMVATVKSLDATRTRVGAGLAIMDGETNTWRVVDPKDGPPGSYRIVEFFEKSLAAMGNYVGCAGLRNLMCVGGALAGARFGPWGATALGLTCVVHQTGECLEKAIKAWPRWK